MPATVTDKPSMIVVRTHIAPGSPNKQDTHDAHGSPLGDEEIRLTKEVYNWPSQEPFFVPDEALAHFRACEARGEELQSAWSEKFEAYRAEHPELAAQFERQLARKLPEGWDADVPKKGPDSGMIATRKASQDVIQWAAAQVPEMVGGSADLAPSTLTLIKDGGSVQPGAYGGRNFHFGIREHGMGAIVNGLTLSGFRAFGAGFFIFSDYMKASIRLAAIMHIPSTFVFTHDSIGVGEDGPTHQPIEQLAALRATPNINVVRPAGFNETALAWRFALSATDTPTALALSRQGVPVWDPDGVPTRRDRARRLRPEGLRGRAGPDPDGLGHRGPRRQRRAEAARGRRREGAAGEHALPGPLRGPGPGVPGRGPAAVREGSRVGRGRGDVGLAPLGRRPRRRRRHDRLRRERARRRALQALWLHRRERRGHRPRRAQRVTVN